MISVMVIRQCKQGLGGALGLLVSLQANESHY